MAPAVNKKDGDIYKYAQHTYTGTPRVDGLNVRTNALLDYFRIFQTPEVTATIPSALIISHVKKTKVLVFL